jgi:hypothetical protein
VKPWRPTGLSAGCQRVSCANTGPRLTLLEAGGGVVITTLEYNMEYYALALHFFLIFLVHEELKT